MSNKPQLEFLFDVSIEIASPYAIGETPHGNRLIVPVTGGSFEGPRLKGKILPGGGDWALGRPDGVGELDVRETWQTEDGALLYVTKRGYLTSTTPELATRWAAGEHIPHEEYYFVVTQYVETSAAQYAWLQQVIAIGMGSLVPGGISYQVFAVREADEVGIQA
jgi:hypothetical protein